MNKAVHALVYVILAVAGVALYFEMNLSEKKELLTDSNKQLRDCIVKLSSFIEAEDAPQAQGDVSAMKDTAPRVANANPNSESDSEMENLLGSYHSEYEKDDLKYFNWKEGGAEYGQLRKVYKLDAEGKKQINPNKSGDGGKPAYIQDGAGTAQELIDKLVARASKMKEVLKNTRVELKNVRVKLQTLANDYNELTKESRQDKNVIAKKEKEVDTLTKEKADVEENLQKSQDEVKELKSEVLSLKEEVTAAKDETIAAKEALDKAKETIDNMKALLQKRTAEPRTQAAGPVTGGGQLTIGNKGTIQKVDNKRLYAVVKFDDAALDELIGSDRNGALPPHEMLVIRPAQGEGGKDEIVSRVRLRQWMPKTNLVTADILPDWQQGPDAIKENDVVRP